jgi:glycosyltransferase involved in cell wall biosynthesis
MLQKMLSVIIPCYNQGAYIQEAIDSVLAQTYTNCEIVIVNDGSTDKATIQKLHKLKEEGFNVITIANSGVSAARNRGIAAAKGEYILPLDADDRIAAEYAEEAIKMLIEKPEIKLVYSDCEYFGSKTGLSNVPAFSMKGMLYENLIFNAAILRKAPVLEIGGYDEAFKIGWEDWDFWLRYITNEKQVYKLNNTHFYYRIKKDSRNSNLEGDNRKLCEQQLFRKHIDKYITIFDKPITYIQSFDFYKSEYNQIEIYRQTLHLSASYKLGHFILKPFKIVKRFLRK